jgi:uncharacterized membrane protein YhiD involved in acid resistance
MLELLSKLSFPNLFTDDITLASVLTRFVVAAVMSSVISVIYRKMNRCKDGNYLMMHTLILMAVGIAAAMMIIGNNLARAFGLVGAVSIIRFRSALKSCRDMAFVLLIIVIGMACGLGYVVLAITTTLFAGCLILLLWKMKIGQRGKQMRQFEIKIHHNGNKCSREKIESRLEITSPSWKFVGLKEDQHNRNFLYTFWVDDYRKVEELTHSLKKVNKKNGIGVDVCSLS